MLSIARLKRLSGTLERILTLPVAELRFDSAISPEHIKATYRSFTKPHPKFLVIKNKTIGAALIDTMEYESADEYLASIAKRNCGGHFADRARMRGFRLVEIDRNAYIDAIHSINTSMPFRQGRAMEAHYRIRADHFIDMENYHYYGVLDSDGKLVAYCDLGIYGNFALLSRLLGYRRNDGFMHFMIVEIVVSLMNQGAVRFAMYDTFFGASDGLRNFKTTLGFKPYRVKYSLN